MNYWYVCLVGLSSVYSYANQPPKSETARIRYSLVQCFEFRPLGTPISEDVAKKLSRKAGLGTSIDSSDTVAQAMRDFCTNHPDDAQTIAPIVLSKLSKSTSILEKKSDEPS